jgi:predicted ATPase/class 3 adenylate cyclase
MRCSKCGADNREGRKFCTTCGTSFVASCPKCGAAVEPGERFCGNCGAALGAALATAADTAPVIASATGERRHLTVLFCDLVGSTGLAAQLDPEEWRETVADYHRAAAEVTTRYGGHVAKYLGDGVMAFFGYPKAHDNDAERAARAGLEMLDAIARLGGEAGPALLAARVGIDSGAVVVGAGAGKETDVFGEAPNVAARVQAAAAPNTVLITAATHRLLAGLFVVEDRGASALKGVEQPVQLYRVIRPTAVRGRLGAAAASHGLTPFVGREDELRLLMNRWERALEGEGQVALVIGEAGIGKSRLLQSFHEQVPARCNWLEAAAAPFFQNTPFYAIGELLRQLGQASPPAAAKDAAAEVETDERLVQLESVLAVAGLKPAEAIPLIAPLLNLPVSAQYALPPMLPEQQRRRLLATLVEWVLGAARAQPLVIAIEDLHWADPSSLELIHLLAEQGAAAPLMLLYTARPEFRPQWPLRAHHTQLTLNRLSARNVREMIAQVAARNALASETVDIVIERTGGVPLFVEELTRVVLEGGSAKLAGREIPVTLHDSLMARLDRLGPAKEVLQIGAVIGNNFSYELLHAVHPVPEKDLQTALHDATDAELVYVRGIAPEAIYQFKHALIRDAAYEALLKSRRKELHRLVAGTIAEKFPVFKEAHPEVLARHWTEAGATEAAIAEWSRTAQRAEAHGAFREAQESYEQALTLLNLLPESRERDLRELELRRSQIAMLHLTIGYAAPETIEANGRARALAEKTGNLTQLVNLMLLMCRTTRHAGNLVAAATIADQALELALRDRNPTNLAVAHELQIGVCYWRGDLAGVEENFAAGLKFFEDPGFRQAGAGILRPNAFGHASWNAWKLGRAELARERAARALAETNQNNPGELMFSLQVVGALHRAMREYEQARQLFSRSLELSQSVQIPEFIAINRVLLGSTLAHLGRPTEGIDLIGRGMASLAQSGFHLPDALYTTWLAEAQALAGAVGDALETVERALVVHPEELISRPESLRLRGELQLKLGQSELAGGDFHEAITLTRKMGAKSLELGATMSLARLPQDTGRRDEARTMLAEIYGWFTEGFDTVDLKDAKSLLEQLAT